MPATAVAQTAAHSKRAGSDVSSAAQTGTIRTMSNIARITPRRSVALVAALALPLAACGDDQAAPDGGVGGEDRAANEEQVPTPGGVVFFTEGAFDGLPVPRGATEAGEKTERSGAVAQSFLVEATGPGQIMDFFTDQLPQLGWQVDEPVLSTGTDSLAAAWVKEDQRLEVSSLLAQGVADERSQFSLVLIDGLTVGEQLNDGE